MSDLPKFSIQEMLEAGVHFGHKEALWNPKVAPFIYGSRNGVHIIDLQKSAALLYKAMQAVAEVAQRRNSQILFVGTKRQAGEILKEAAKKCGQFYINHRWLGGTLTNWPTISKSIKKLTELEGILKAAEAGEETKYNKKELLGIDRKRQKLDNALGGIRKLKGKPDLIFIIDTNKEKIAVKEAQALKVPIVAIIDTNSNIDGIDYIIPGNDDASKAIAFYCKMISDAALCGVEKLLTESGIDLDEQKFEEEAAEENLEQTDSAEIVFTSKNQNDNSDSITTEEPVVELKTKKPLTATKAEIIKKPSATKSKKAKGDK